MADPAKNITVFVFETVEDPALRMSIAQSILASPSLKAEQVGFVFSPEIAESFVPTAGRGFWRLEMAGGEFCGNAARSFGLYVAKKQGLQGRGEVQVSISGKEEPVLVTVDTEENTAAAEIPIPKIDTPLKYNGGFLSTYVFEGITHVIAPDMDAYGKTFFSIRQFLEDRISSLKKPLPEAIGVMFYDTRSGLMRPAVFVRSIDSFFFESSCGSGSAALAVWLSQNLSDGFAWHTVRQPGGVIKVKTFKEKGTVKQITIGGEVKLGERREFNAL